MASARQKLANPKTVAANLKAAMTRAGLGARSLAAQLTAAMPPGSRGTSYGGIRSLLEAKIDNPRFDVLTAAAQILGVSADWLIRNRGGMTAHHERIPSPVEAAAFVPIDSGATKEHSREVADFARTPSLRAAFANVFPATALLHGPALLALDDLFRSVSLRISETRYPSPPDGIYAPEHEWTPELRASKNDWVKQSERIDQEIAREVADAIAAPLRILNVDVSKLYDYQLNRYVQATCIALQQVIGGTGGVLGTIFPDFDFSLERGPAKRKRTKKGGK